jgi:hypothetical protein
MGWTFGYAGPAEIRRDLKLFADRTLKVVAQAATCYGRHLWTLYEMGSGRRFVHFDLIEKRGGDWGVKSMDESTGPLYYDCPLALLDGASAPSNEHAKAWREKVRDLHAKSTRQYSSGDVVIIGTRRYRVIEQVKRSYHVLSLDSGRVYKCSPAKMTNVPSNPLSLEEV